MGRGKQQTQVPITRQVLLANVQLSTVSLSSGGRQLQMLDPFRAEITMIDLSAEQARALGKQLSSALDVAGPGDVPAPGNGGRRG